MQNEYAVIDDNDSIEVELASGWERIGAYILNNVFSTIAAIPLIVGIVVPLVQIAKDGALTEETLFAAMFGTWFWVGLLIYFAFVAWQIYLMSKYGQSLGKKLLNLRVIRTNGDDAGFVNVVLLREVVYNIGLGVVAAILGIVVGEGAAELAGNALSVLASLICLILLFADRERRTLQDYLGDTIVIKLPR